MPSAAHLSVSLNLCSSGSNKQGNRGPLKGAMSAQKALQRVPDGDEGGGGKNAREVFTPMMGYCFKQTNDLFFKKDTEKLT